MVLDKGKVVITWGDVSYDYGCHSIRKGLLFALYGIHIAEGNIDPEKTLAELEIDE